MIPQIYIFCYNYEQSVCIYKLNENSILNTVNAGVRSHWFLDTESCTVIYRLLQHPQNWLLCTKDCWHFVYKSWTIRVCSLRLYLFLKVRLQNWQMAVGMPLCWVRMWRRRLPIDKTEGQCGQYSVPIGSKGIGVPTSNAEKKECLISVLYQIIP